MNISLNFNLVIFLVMVTSGCSNTSSQKEKAINIQRVDEFHFRRTYADIQFIDDEKEQALYLERQEKSQPQLIDVQYDTLLKKRLEVVGLVRGFELSLNDFQPVDSSYSFELKDSLNRLMKVRFDPGPDSLQISISRGPGSNFIKQACEFSELQFTLSDVLPGGNKEILLLRKYYVMNGYNFDLDIYEIW